MVVPSSCGGEDYATARGPDEEQHLGGCRSASECANRVQGEREGEMYRRTAKGKWCWGYCAERRRDVWDLPCAGVCCLAAVDRGCAELPRG
jgi:hypothetical protein